MAQLPKSLVRARFEAHEAFDPLWQASHFTREVAYRWLALKLGVPPKRAHISKLDRDQCRRLVEACRNFDIADPLIERAIREMSDEDGWRRRKEVKLESRKRRHRKEYWAVRARNKRAIFGVVKRRKKRRAAP